MQFGWSFQRKKKNKTIQHTQAAPAPPNPRESDKGETERERDLSLSWWWLKYLTFANCTKTQPCEYIALSPARDLDVGLEQCLKAYALIKFRKLASSAHPHITSQGTQELDTVFKEHSRTHTILRSGLKSHVTHTFHEKKILYFQKKARALKVC